MPLNVALWKIDVSIALLFLLMEMSKSDIFFVFSFFTGEFNTMMARVNGSKNFS